MSDEIASLLSPKNKRDFRTLARLLTAIERAGPKALKNKALLKPPTVALRVGITGPPGAGKSTLIAKMIQDLRSRGKTVAVLAVDPSSPFSHGAILGDRIRYADSFNDPGVFIRSIGSRGSQGGMTAIAYLLLRAFDLWNFDVVLIETVGVGQTELEVMYVADYVIVTLVPEGGDAIQAMKAGLLEIANLFVVNKADRPGAESFAKELKSTLEISDEKIQVMLTSANENKGVKQVVDEILNANTALKIKKLREQKVRLQAEARALLSMSWMNQISKKISSLSTADMLSKLFK